MTSAWRVQHLVSREDLDGRPRRLYVVYNEDGRAIEAYDAPDGKPLELRGMKELLSHNIVAVDYENLRGMFTKWGILRTP